MCFMSIMSTRHFLNSLDRGQPNSSIKASHSFDGLQDHLFKSSNLALKVLVIVWPRNTEVFP